MGMMPHKAQLWTTSEYESVPKVAGNNEIKY